LTMGIRFIKNYKWLFCASLTNTTAGELLRKCVNKGKSKKLQRCPNNFLSKYYLLHLVTHEK
jgi:hypothetical protein